VTSERQESAFGVVKKSRPPGFQHPKPVAGDGARILQMLDHLDREQRVQMIIGNGQRMVEVLREPFDRLWQI
jgi:hypothetical protein